MNDVIDRILSTYQLMRPLDPDRVSDSRQRITRYIESLASAGQSDPQQLAVYGLAYLKELHEKRDPRFTGSRMPVAVVHYRFHAAPPRGRISYRKRSHVHID